MDALKAMRTWRRSAKFVNKTVPETDWKEIVRAASNAASAGKKKPWHFLILRDRELLKRLAVELKQPESLAAAPIAIAVCADSTVQRHMGHWVVDCSAATENLILAAHAKDLGSAWGRVFPRKSRMEAAGKLLKLPQHVTVFSIVFVGHPEKATSKRSAVFDKDRIHVESW